MMFVFRCGLDFHADRPFDELAGEFSRRYLGNLRFIPADRRDAREFARAEFVEYTLFNHDLDLIWNDDNKRFGMFFQEGVNEVWFPEHNSQLHWKHGSFQRCLAVLLRQIEGVRDICINPNTAGPYLDVWQAKLPFNSRRTVQEVGALLAQKLFCGFRFVPSGGAIMREATSFHTEHELLGHRIELHLDELGHHILSVKPSPSFLGLLAPDERAILRGLDIRDWIKAPFLNHPWIRPSSFYDDEPSSAGESNSPT